MNKIIGFVITRLFAIFISLNSATLVADGGTSIGGGDPIYFFLDNARSIIFQISSNIVSDNSDNSDLCRKALQHSTSQHKNKQIEFCKNFILQTATQFIDLIQGPRSVKLVIQTSGILTVPGPDGKPIRVAATTPIGPYGDITFPREDIKSMDPNSLVMLLSHEYGHKSKFLELYFEDNLPVDSVDQSGLFRAGREFLDIVGAAYANKGRNLGLIGDSFAIQDIFNCVQCNDANCARESQYILAIPENRRYFDQGIRTQYRTGFGYQGSESGPSYPEAGTTNFLKPSIEIYEPNNCADITLNQNFNRKTVIRMRRIFAQTAEDPTVRPDEIVSERTLDGFNPMCLLPSSSDSRLKMDFSYNGIDLRCKYGFSRGVGQFTSD